MNVHSLSIAQRTAINTLDDKNKRNHKTTKNLYIGGGVVRWAL